MTKQEAIKEIEKLTNQPLRVITSTYAIFGKEKELITLYKYFTPETTYEFNLEPLSRLIPILFKNDVDNSILTKQSKTIKEGE